MRRRSSQYPSDGAEHERDRVAAHQPGGDRADRQEHEAEHVDDDPQTPTTGMLSSAGVLVSGIA